MHVLITGGAGFIGSNLTAYHLQKNDKVHAVDDLSTGRMENMAPYQDNPDFIFDEADILLWPGLEEAVHWADRIYHMAAVVGVFRVLEDPIKVLATNVAGTERVLRMAHLSGWKPQVLIASSSEVYGHGLKDRQVCKPSETFGETLCCTIPIEEATVAEFQEDNDALVGSSAVSRWNYSISKLTDEAFGLSYARMHGMPVVVGRFFNMIGPGQTGRYGMVVPRFVGQALSGEPITVFGNGKQMRSFCDVRDTVSALDALMSNPEAAGQIVNVGNDREISIVALAELIKELSGSASPIKFIPYLEAYGEQFEESYRRRPNLQRFFKLTGFKHKWTLEDTLRDLIEAGRRLEKTTKAEV